MPKKVYDKPTPAYKHMRELNKAEGKGKYGVVEHSNGYKVIQTKKNPLRVVNKTRGLKAKKAIPNFNMKNTSVIKAKAPPIKVPRKESGKFTSADIVKFKAINKAKKGKGLARTKSEKLRILDKQQANNYRRQELAKVARAKLLRGENIKSERRENLKKGK